MQTINKINHPQQDFNIEINEISDTLNNSEPTIIKTNMDSSEIMPLNEPNNDNIADATLEQSSTEQVYTVQDGDTLSEIAEENDLELTELMEYNDIDPATQDYIEPGQEIRIPSDTYPEELTEDYADETTEIGELSEINIDETTETGELSEIDIDETTQGGELSSGEIIDDIDPRDIREDTMFEDEELTVRDDLITDMTTEDEGISPETLEMYNRELEEYIAQHGSSQRERAVAAAIFLATRFPKIPYFWGGGHELSAELMGINPKWGTNGVIEFGGDDKYEEGTIWPYSLDCSGFVSWCMINAGIPLGYCYNTTNFGENHTHHSITEEGIIDNIHVGDLAFRALGGEHVGIIVDVDRENNTITIAHVSGSGEGMNLTTMSTITGEIVEDSMGRTGDREDKYYFEEIILWDYNDEQENVHY